MIDVTSKTPDEGGEKRAESPILTGPEREAFLREFQEILKDVPPARKWGERVALKHFHEAMIRVSGSDDKP